MFDIIIQQVNNGLFNDAKEIFSFASNVAITGLTLYTAWLRFLRKRIDLISLETSYNRHLGCVISYVIENQTLSNFTIGSIDIVIEDKYIVQLKEFKEPFIVEPFKAYKIQSDEITDSRPLDIETLSRKINLDDCYCIIYTSKGKIISYPKTTNWFKRPRMNKKKDYTRISKEYNYFNGRALNKNVKYALCILCENGNYKDIFIDKYGLMSEDLYGINNLPEHIVSDLNLCYEYFKQIGIEKGITFYLYNVAIREENAYIKFTPQEEQNNNDA